MKTVSLLQQFVSLYKRSTVHFLQGDFKLMWFFFYVEEMSSKGQNRNGCAMPRNFALFEDNVNW
jgi:hypothetical protein